MTAINSVAARATMAADHVRPCTCIGRLQCGVEEMASCVSASAVSSSSGWADGAGGTGMNAVKQKLSNALVKSWASTKQRYLHESCSCWLLVASNRSALALDGEGGVDGDEGTLTSR